MSPPETPFQEAVKVTPVPGTDAQFSATVPWDWCGGTHAHGGYITSLFMSTARVYFQTKYSSKDSPDPINIHVQFLAPTPVGDVTLSVEDLAINTRYSVVQVSLSNTGKEKSAIAIVTQGNLALETGPSIPVPPTVLKDGLPDPKDCELDTTFKQLVKIYPVAGKTTILKYKGGERGRCGSREGLNVKEKWLRWTDERESFGLLSLGSICDCMLSAPTNFFDDMEDLRKYVYPTHSLSIEVKRDVRDEKWLFMKIVCHEIRNGRFDHDVYVYNDRAELVALSKHVCSAVPLKKSNGGKL